MWWGPCVFSKCAVLVFPPSLLTYLVATNFPSAVLSIYCSFILPLNAAHHPHQQVPRG